MSHATRRPVFLSIALLLGGAVAACSSSSGEEVQRLRSESQALGRAEGCTAVSECEAKPMGAKGCGGPAAYIVICTKTTDLKALDAKLEELRVADERLNKEREDDGLADTCSIVPAPKVALVDGACRAE